MIKLSCQIVKANNILLLKYEKINDPFSRAEIYSSPKQDNEQSEESKHEIEEESKLEIKEESKPESKQYLSVPSPQNGTFLSNSPSQDTYKVESSDS